MKCSNVVEIMLSLSVDFVSQCLHPAGPIFGTFLFRNLYIISIIHVYTDLVDECVFSVFSVFSLFFAWPVMFLSERYELFTHMQD